MFSVLITVHITFQLMEPILHYFIPPYENYYQLLKNINNLENKFSMIFLFYISFLVVYFLIFSFLLFKILTRKKMQNIYTTIIILVIFNASIMSSIMYINFESKNSSIRWANFTKVGCVRSYKVINNIDNNTNFIPSLEAIKPCLLDVVTY